MAIIKPIIRSIIPCASKQLWTPSNTTTSLWLDPTDTATITESGNFVSQIDDKSGNGLHAIELSGSKQPTTNLRSLNGLNVLDFDGIDDRMVFGNIDLLNKTIVGVWITDSLSATTMLFGGSGVNNQGRLNTNGVVAYTSGASAYVGAPNSGQARMVVGQASVVAKAYDDDGFGIGLDGTWAKGGTYNTGTTGTLFGQICARGAVANGTNFFNGAFAGWAVFDSDDDIRLRMIGYFAWRFGLESQLPVGFIYKNNPPTV